MFVEWSRVGWRCCQSETRRAGWRWDPALQGEPQAWGRQDWGQQSSVWEEGECAGQQESREGGVLNVASRLPELLETPSGAGHVAGW